jgi:hypothetical protein
MNKSDCLKLASSLTAAAAQLIELATTDAPAAKVDTPVETGPETKVAKNKVKPTVIKPIYQEPALENEVKPAVEVTIADLKRKAISLIADHKPAITEKLQEFGVGKVSDIPKERFGEFNAFLDTLSKG